MISDSLGTFLEGFWKKLIFMIFIIFQIFRSPPDSTDFHLVLFIFLDPDGHFNFRSSAGPPEAKSDPNGLGFFLEQRYFVALS